VALSQFLGLQYYEQSERSGSGRRGGESRKLTKKNQEKNQGKGMNFRLCATFG